MSDTAGTFTELSTQIEASDNLVLDKNYTRGSNENIIHINKTITIDGQNNTINANGYNGVFNISSTANVTLQNMIITNASDAYSSYTAPIYAEGTLTLINVTISDNYYSYGVGAITQEDGQLTVINSTFIDNYGQQGGAVYLRYGTSTMDNVTVINCSSMNGAIFIQYASASLNISNSTFKDNYANNYGGAIDSSRGSLVVDNCIFTNNSAGVFGGAIALRTSKVTSISNSIFTSNYVNGSTSTKRGGAIYTTGTVNLVNNTMTDNYAYNGTTILLNEGVVNNTYVKVNDQTALEDEIFTIEATVTDDNNNTITGGTLTITINGVEYTSEVVEGVATYTISTSLEANTYTVTSVYSQVNDDTTCIYTDGTLVVTATDVFKYSMLQESIDQDTTGTITLEKIVKREAQKIR